MRRLALLVALLAPTVACDQATKSLAVTHLQGRGVVNVVDGLFRLIYAENPGAFLGLGKNLPDGARAAVFTAGVAVMLLVLAVVVVRGRLHWMPALGLALVLAGGIGNLVDRVARPGHRVVDFAQLSLPTPWGTPRTGVFNVADLYIMGGAALVGLSSFRRRQPEAEPAAAGSALAPGDPPQLRG